MSFGSETIYTVHVQIESDPGGNDNYHLIKMPRAATILSAYMVSENAIAAGTGITLTLTNWGTSGTAVEGTIAAAIGTGISADVPTAATITSASARVDAGDWLVVALTEVGGGWQSGDRVVYQVDYVHGH